MQAVAISAEQLGIEELRGRIDGWRQSAPKSRNMPEELWKDACAAAKRLGACRVARALGVKYETLKQRVLASGGAGMGGEATVLPSGTQFIELTGLSAASHRAVGNEAVVEVVAADGARLTIRLKGAGLDIAALVSAFRGRS
ncbi:MAG TPA: hypothetical protein VFW10_01080 [Steroidobacteraceae bacterium]|nr:hypothetical protein [Steroidobacteraceae bacterium]